MAPHISLNGSRRRHYPRVGLTIRETCRHVYPFMSFQTIHQWMDMEIFTPVQQVGAGAGPGSGCKLDFADLVTVGVLHSMLSCGVRFQDIRHDQNQYEMHFAQPTDTETAPAFRKAQVPWRRLGRDIQSFLEQHGFGVYTYVHRYHPSSVSNKIDSRITFYPSDMFWKQLEEPKEYSRNLSSEWRDTYHATTGHVVINCRTWHDLVLGNLKKHGYLR